MKLTIIELVVCLFMVSLYALALYCYHRTVKKLSDCADRVLAACRIQS